MNDLFAKNLFKLMRYWFWQFSQRRYETQLEFIRKIGENTEHMQGTGCNTFLVSTPLLDTQPKNLSAAAELHN